MQWTIFLYVLAFGACVGSFLNVVVYRLPLGRSLLHPPSSCPQCGHRLAWHDNVPVLGWLWLRGRCRYCKTAISAQYPLVEALTAALFGVVYLLYYMGGSGGGGLAELGIERTWIVLAVHLILVAGLLAATMIDAKLFIIPLQIPWFVTAVAAVLLPLAAWLEPAAAGVTESQFVWFVPPTARVMPVVDGGLAGAALGGMAGLAVAVILLQLKVLPLSFADDPAAHDQPAQEQPGTGSGSAPQAMTQDEQDAYLAYPHARREMGKELLFLAFPTVGGVAGAILWRWLAAEQALLLPTYAQVLCGVMLGYLIGGAVVWGTRVLGTLLFGKEAMGLGDVHLLAAVGAVLGAKEVTVLFFIAPFFGLAYALGAGVMGKVTRWKWRMIPYGPFLAAASVLMMFQREPILRYLGLW